MKLKLASVLLLASCLASCATGNSEISKAIADKIRLQSQPQGLNLTRADFQPQSTPAFQAFFKGGAQ